MGVAIGLSACAISSLLFGSQFVAVKRCSPGDGIFVQWCMSCAILVVGVVVYATQGFPEFEPLAIVGGVLWALGNSTAIPIMNQIGIGMGMLVWGTTNCVAGWAAGRFGLFGINATTPSIPLLNYSGLVLVILGGFLFSQIRPNSSADTQSETSPLMAEPDDELADEFPSLQEQLVRTPSSLQQTVVGAHRSRRRLMAIGLSLIAGIFYGFTFVPVIYIQDHPEIYPTAPKTGLGIVFSHFVGIFLTSTAIMAIYVVGSRNNPYVSSKLVGPSLLAGAMWGIAQSSWFVANDNLSQAVSFPIIAMMPGVCAALWSVFYFRDIEGRRNLKLLTIAVSITLTGAIFVGVSK